MNPSAESGKINTSVNTRLDPDMVFYKVGDGSEIRIGQIVSVKGEMTICKESDTCDGCIMNCLEEFESMVWRPQGPCEADERADGQSVCFLPLAGGSR